MSVVYRSGATPLVVRRDVALLTPDLATARRTWDLLTAGAEPDELLRELVRDGFVGMPQFVLVDATGSGVRVLLRGDARAEVETAATPGTTRWTGAGVSTWAERSFDRVTAVRVRIAEPETEQDAESLPLGQGIVRCGGFEFHPEDPENPEDPEDPESPEDAARRDGSAPVQLPAPQVIADVPATAVPIPDDPDARPEASRDPAQTRTDDPDDGFDHLFESTIVRSVEDAAVREIVEDPAATEAGRSDDPIDEPPVRPGDHDGYTITSADLEELRERTPDTDPLPTSESPVDPDVDRARLELSTGDVITLDRDVVIGRRPEVDRVQGGQMPTVVTVPSPQQDVSRTHLRIGRTGGAFTATDLHSMNGTVLIGTDGTTRTLDGGAPQTLNDGDTLDIGDGVTLTLRLGQ